MGTKSTHSTPNPTTPDTAEPDASHEATDTQNATTGHDAPTQFDRRNLRASPPGVSKTLAEDIVDASEPAPNTKRPVDLAVAASLADEEKRIAEARVREEEAMARSQRAENNRVAARHR